MNNSFRRSVSDTLSSIVPEFSSVIKSPTDLKDYKLIQLENGLKALLISDTAYDLKKLDQEELEVENGVTNGQTGLKRSAASLRIEVGSYSDPEELQGLAHFLEHMVFMGSKKYPSENEFTKFIDDHDGSYNAYTDDEFTNFHFAIPRKNFAK